MLDTQLLEVRLKKGKTGALFNHNLLILLHLDLIRMPN